MKTMLYTTFALMAFAGNSVLCRLALGEGVIDAGSFTAIRLLSGILVLVLVYSLKSSKSGSASKGSWQASLMLFLYAISFSYAYITLDTGTGALILFACVQITILLLNFVSGNKLYFIEWCGVAVAFVGFIYLLLPHLSTPSLMGFILMSVSGVAWGLYTLAGKGSVNPLGDTAYNFLRTLPLAILLLAFTIDMTSLSPQGIMLASMSGAITSGLGYTLWYMALREILSVQAAVVQLLVPVIAAFGGVLFVGEIITMRLALSSAIILLDILTVVLGRQYMVHRIQK